MPAHWEGELAASPGKYLIVASRYNVSITDRLVEGAVATLSQHGVAAEAIKVVHVPGAWEIPLAVQWALQDPEVIAVLCLGAVIRGETSHDQHINQQVSGSLGELALEFGIPISFGVLTCNTREQAVARAGGSVGNKGEECALAVLQMASLRRRLLESDS